MKGLQSLLLLLEKEKGRREEARAALRAAVRQAEGTRTQLDGLAGYRGEYCRRWSAEFSRSAAMEIVRCYQGFISRLDQAITQQQGVVQAAERGVETARKHLVHHEVRVATIERLIQRRREQLARIADRRETKLLDELAQRPAAAAALAGIE